MPVVAPLVGQFRLVVLVGTVALVNVATSAWQSAPNLPKSFDAASIKPSTATEKAKAINSFRWESGRFTATDISTGRLIEIAYGLRQQQLERLPNWAKSQGYTIQAVMPPDMPQLTAQETPQVRRQMLQSLLADRFALKMHKTIEQLRVYELVVAKGGPKLTPHGPSEQGATGLWAESDRFKFVGVPLGFLAGYISTYAGRIVLDRTGLTGRYDFTLSGVRWSPNPAATRPGMEPGAPAQADSQDESIFDAMADQLGLQLKDARDPVPVLVVDHVEPPTAN